LDEEYKVQRLAWTQVLTKLIQTHSHECKKYERT